MSDPPFYTSYVSCVALLFVCACSAFLGFLDVWCVVLFVLAATIHLCTKLFEFLSVIREPWGTFSGCKMNERPGYNAHMLKSKNVWFSNVTWQIFLWLKQSVRPHCFVKKFIFSFLENLTPHTSGQDTSCKGMLLIVKCMLCVLDTR